MNDTKPIAALLNADGRTRRSKQPSCSMRMDRWMNKTKPKAELLHADGQMDEQDEANSRFSQLFVSIHVFVRPSVRQHGHSEKILLYKFGKYGLILYEEGNRPIKNFAQQQRKGQHRMMRGLLMKEEETDIKSGTKSKFPLSVFI
jgi:hypothetical protein